MNHGDILMKEPQDQQLITLIVPDLLEKIKKIKNEVNQLQNQTDHDVQALKKFISQSEQKNIPQLNQNEPELFIQAITQLFYSNQTPNEIQESFSEALIKVKEIHENQKNVNLKRTSKIYRNEFPFQKIKEACESIGYDKFLQFIGMDLSRMNEIEKQFNNTGEKKEEKETQYPKIIEALKQLHNDFQTNIKNKLNEIQFNDYLKKLKNNINAINLFKQKLGSPVESVQKNLLDYATAFHQSIMDYKKTEDKEHKGLCDLIQKCNDLLELHKSSKEILLELIEDKKSIDLNQIEEKIDTIKSSLINPDIS